MLRSTNSPFPGMNPFFEESRHWRGFHNNLASEIVAALVPRLGDGYAAQLEIESVMESVSVSESVHIRPDVAIVDTPRESGAQPQTDSAIASPPTERRKILVKSPEKLRRVLIRMTDSDELVTIIEILSPSNKRSQGLADYQQKRYTILMSDVHFVEIDLLRGGTRPGEEVVTAEPYDYATVVNRAGPERISEIWRSALNEPLPSIPIPLRYPDKDIVLDINRVIELIYTRYGFSKLIDYGEPIPKPNLRPDVAEWWEAQKDLLSS